MNLKNKYYNRFNDWDKLKPSEKPERIPSFGFGNGKKSEILIQGNFVKKMIVFLTEKGYRVKQKGGA